MLTIDTDWAWHQWDHLFGSFTYGDQPVFGFSRRPPVSRSTRSAATSTSTPSTRRTAQGWKRENSFLTHTNTGVFCYSFNPHGARPDGKGTQYRATVDGPGVTPDVMWQGASPGTYDKAADLVKNDAIALGDRQCKAN